MMALRRPLLSLSCGCSRNHWLMILSASLRVRLSSGGHTALAPATLKSPMLKPSSRPDTYPMHHIASMVSSGDKVPPFIDFSEDEQRLSRSPLVTGAACDGQAQNNNRQVSAIGTATVAIPRGRFDRCFDSVSVILLSMHLVQQAIVVRGREHGRDRIRQGFRVILAVMQAAAFVAFQSAAHHQFGNL